MDRKRVSRTMSLLSIAILAILCVVSSSLASDARSWRHVISRVQKSVVFLGAKSKTGQPAFKASAVIIQVNGVLHLLTAKHVIAEQRDGRFTGRLTDDPLIAYFNNKDGTVAQRSIGELKKELQVEWVFHSRPEVDLAILPFGINEAMDDVLAVPDSMFLGISSLTELTNVFFVSYQPGLVTNDRIRPIYRVGTVSLVLPDKTFYIDGAAFPGNSGSPVFVRPEPTGFADSGPPVFPAPNSGKFVGIVGEYLPYQEVAISSQTQRPRVVFEEHTGLSRVWSIDLIQEIINSSSFRAQLMRLKRAWGSVEKQRP